MSWDTKVALNSLLPSQSGAAGLVLTSDGTNTYWGSAGGGGSGITQLTSDVLAGPGFGSQVATIATGAVTFAKMANLAANSIIGNNTGSPAAPLALTTAQTKTLLAYYTSGDNVSFGSGVFSSTISASNLSGTNTGDQTITLTGDVTGSGTGSFAATIASGAVSLAKMANLAASSIIGNNTGSPATPTALTVAQAQALLLPSQSGHTSQFLQTDGAGTLTWATASGGSGITQLTSDVTAGPGSGSQVATISAGAVTLAKMANLAANSIIGNNTGSPATPIALTTAQTKTLLGYYTSGDSPTFNAITTTTINGGSLSGSNSGDQTITLTGDVTGSGTGSFATTLASTVPNDHTFSGKITLGSDVVFALTTNSTLTGTNQIVPSHPTGFIKFTNASLVSLAGMNNTGVTDGHLVWLDNEVGASLTISHNSVAASAGQQFYCPFAQDVTLPSGSSLPFVYSTTIDGGEGGWLLASNGFVNLGGNGVAGILPVVHGGTNASTTSGALATFGLTNVLTGTTGDVASTASGVATAAATIQAGAVTLAKMANLPANTFIGNNTGGSATPLALTVAQMQTALSIPGAAITQLTSDVTAGPGSGSQAATIAANAVTYAKFQKAVGNNVVLGNIAGANSAYTELTGAQVATLSGAITSLTTDVTTSGSGAATATIAAGAVTLAKMANLAANSIIGNNTGSPTTPIALTTAQTKTLLGYYTSGDSPTFNAITTTTINGGTLSGNNSGDVTIAAFGSSPTANAATISGQAITFQPADFTHPGAVSTVSQIFAGNKTIGGAATNSRDATLTLKANGTNNTTLYLEGTGGIVIPSLMMAMPGDITFGVIGYASGVFNLSSDGNGSNFLITPQYPNSYLTTYPNTTAGIHFQSHNGTSYVDGILLKGGGVQTLTFNDGSQQVTAHASGSATVNFGAAPGTNSVTTVVTGLTTIPAGAKIMVTMADSSADHNAIEHVLVDVRHIATSVVAGTGFTILSASATMRLTGRFTVNWYY